MFLVPSNILPGEVFSQLTRDESSLFPNVVSFFLLLWGLFILISTWKSKPVFEAEMKDEKIKWLVQVGKEETSVKEKIALALGENPKAGTLKTRKK